MYYILHIVFINKISNISEGYFFNIFINKY